MRGSQARAKIHFHSDCTYFGGADNMLATLLSSTELKNEYDISFSYRFTPLYADGLARRVQVDFPIYPLSFPEIFNFSVLPTKLPQSLRRLWFFAQRIGGFIPLLAWEVWVFYRLMRRIRPDIAHINNGGYPGALSARAAAIGAKLAGVPVVVMFVNNMAVGYDNMFRWLDYPIDRMVIHTVNNFLTGSLAASERLVKVLGLTESRSSAINHGINYSPARLTPDETRQTIEWENFAGVIFGIIGVLGPRKGHRILFEAARRLINQHPEDLPSFKIVIVGDGDSRTELEELVKEKGLSDYCLFVGEKREDEVMNYMEMIDALVLPSTEREDFPFVILEAMSHRKPVIASKIAGTVEQVVHGVTGLLLDPGDVSQLSAALQEVASSPELRRQMGAAGYDYYLKHFTAERAVGRYLLSYANYLSGSGDEN